MKKLVTLMLFIMLFGMFSIHVQAAENDKISEDLQKVMEAVDEDFQIDIIVDLKAEEDEARFIEAYLNDGRYYSNYKYSVALYFDATKEEILMYAQLDEVVAINTFRTFPDKTIYNLGSTELSDERAKIIKADYLKVLNDPLRLPEEIIIWYYGTVKDYEVLNMSVAGEVVPDVSGQVVVNNYYFDFGYQSDANRFFIHKDGEFIHIKTAYEQGLLNDDDIAAIAKNFSGAYQIIDGTYFLVLQEKTEKEIKEAYLKKLKFENPYDREIQSLTVDDLTIYDYYGTYEGHAIFTIAPTQEFPESITKARVRGYPFTINSALYPDNFLSWDGEYLISIDDSKGYVWMKGDYICEIAQLRNMIIDAAEFSEIYKDVSFSKDWFAREAYKTYVMGLMTGLSEDTFGPYESLSRAQFATILYRIVYPDMDIEAFWDTTDKYGGVFKDIAGNEWYAREVIWAYENGIVTGYLDGNFGPADPITREQMAVMLYRFAFYRGYNIFNDYSLAEFGDRRDISSFAYNGMKWCVGKKIITGNNGNLKPQDICSRAECAAMITRVVEKFE